MQGSRLSLDMLIVHGLRNLLKQFVKAAQSVGLEVVDLACSGLCSALATLTPEQKECGALVIDLGAGTSSYLVYHDGIIADVGVLAVGGDHVTNDIALGFNLPMKRAEALKELHGATAPFRGPVPADHDSCGRRVCRLLHSRRRSLHHYQCAGDRVV